MSDIVIPKYKSACGAYDVSNDEVQCFDQETAPVWRSGDEAFKSVVAFSSGVAGGQDRPVINKTIQEEYQLLLLAPSPSLLGG